MYVVEQAEQAGRVTRLTPQEGTPERNRLWELRPGAPQPGLWAQLYESWLHV